MSRVFIITIGILSASLNADGIGQAQSPPGPFAASADARPLLTRLRQGGVLESPGAIRTFYEASTKERALRLQKSLEAAHEWYQQQLNVKVPIVLVVLHDATRRKILGTPAVDHTFFPHDGEPGMIALADPNPAARPVPGADADHNVGGLLHQEHLMFHEDGHFFADALKIRTSSKSLYEFVPAVFMVAYLQQARPDLNFQLQKLRADSLPLPRYTSWADFDDFPGMDTENHQWFLYQLERTADVLTLNQNFATLVQKMRSEFPAVAERDESPEDIRAHLMNINPAFKPPLERLFEPTTIPLAAKTTCGQSKTGNNPSVLLIRNNRAEPLTVLQAETARIIQPYSRGGLRGIVGTVIRLGETCFAIGDEPTIVTVN